MAARLSSPTDSLSTDFVLYSRLNEIPAVTWEQVKTADKTRNSLKVTTAIIDYIKSNPMQSLQTVEIRLRKEHCFTHLVARENDPGIPRKAKILDWEGNLCKFSLWTITRDKEIALKEKYLYTPNSMINLENLKETGFVSVSDEDMLESMMESLLAVGGYFELNELGTKILADKVDEKNKNKL